MVNISMKALLEAGAHFGHQTRRWNPKMGRFIFGERNNIHIIDLQKTVKELKKAYGFVRDSVAAGKVVMFVGTKKQAQDIIKGEAIRCGAAHVHEKWLGGTMTNFKTIRKSVARLEELERWETDGIFKVLSKKEVSRLTKEGNRLRKLLTGIRHLEKLPDLLFVIDPVEEEGAVAEARKLKIPVVAICDTNCDPDLIDHPVPGNDDAARSIKLFVTVMADAVIEGRQLAEKAANPEEAMMAASEEAPAEGEPAAEEGAAVEEAAPTETEPAQN